MHYTSLTEKRGKQVHQMPSNKQNNQRHSTTGKIWHIFVLFWKLSGWWRSCKTFNLGLRTHKAMKYVRCTVRDSQIRSEMSWSSTHTKIWTLKNLHHCTQHLNHKYISMSSFETPLAVIKDEKIVKNQDGGLKCLCLTLSRVNVTLDAKISFVPTHQLIVPSTLLAPATHIRTHKVTQPRRFIRSNHWHIWAIFSK